MPICPWTIKRHMREIQARSMLDEYSELCKYKIQYTLLSRVVPSETSFESSLSSNHLAATIPTFTSCTTTNNMYLLNQALRIIRLDQDIVQSMRKGVINLRLSCVARQGEYPAAMELAGCFFLSDDTHRGQTVHHCKPNAWSATSV